MKYSTAAVLPAKRRTRRPLRVDFLLLTANDAEARAACRALDLQYEGDVRDNLPYYWGYITPNHGNPPHTIALIGLDDYYGRTAAYQQSKKAIELLRPRFFIVLGIAAGACTTDTNLRPGDIIYSTLVRTGIRRFDGTLREEPIHQPSPTLINAAKRTAEGETWKDGLDHSKWSTALACAELPEDTELPRVIPGEVVSTDTFVTPYEKFVCNCVKAHHKLAAFDMETGGVGVFMRELADVETPPSYLFIKSISDIVYEASAAAEITPEKQHELVDSNKRERECWKPFASHASVVFVKRMLTEFRLSTHCPMRPDVLWPPTPRKPVEVNSGCIAVYTAVESEAYSALATRLLSHIAEDAADGARPDTDEHFFTVCAFSPRSLWEEIVRAAKRRGETVRTLDEVYNASVDIFPHFRTFVDHASTHASSGVRVLLLEDFETWLPKSKRGLPTARCTLPDHWKLFLRLNGYDDEGQGDGLPFWGIDRKSLRGWRDEQKRFRFLTDYVVLGRDLILDYYSESGILIASEGARNSTKGYFMDLHGFFFEKKDKSNGPFRSAQELHSSAVEAFGSVGLGG